MKRLKHVVYILSLITLLACNGKQDTLSVELYETAANGNKLTKINDFSNEEITTKIQIFPDKEYQSIIGFGGAFTESSAYLLNQLSNKNRNQILEAYFGSSGAMYSLTRTHINSCDFSLGNYSYAPVEGDMDLENFSIDEDRGDLIPMIREAMAKSEDGFKILASPWTAPPWMKDNNSWKGGKLLPEYYDTWAMYFSRYLDEYKKEGIDIWGITVENEPLGNNSNWESMHFTAEETVDFIGNHLGPKLEQDGHDIKIFAYDQNRDKHLKDWAKVLYKDELSSKYIDGTAVHWYASTLDWFPEALEFTHDMAPDKHILHTEACIDAEVPHWQEDEWYWQKEATDWGWDWAPEDEKKHHPKYVPVYRYARDIIGCLNSWTEGWIDWNMVLDRQGGPNWAKNWCIAPVIVDPDNDEVYFTPLFFIMSHFSKYIRPGAVRIGFNNSDQELMMTAAKNPDGTIVVILLNMDTESKNIKISLKGRTADIHISPCAIQSLIITI